MVKSTESQVQYFLVQCFQYWVLTIETVWYKKDYLFLLQKDQVNGRLQFMSHILSMQWNKPGENWFNTIHRNQMSCAVTNVLTWNLHSVQSEAGQLNQLDQRAVASLTLENKIFFKRAAATLLNIVKVFNTTLSNCSGDILAQWHVWKHTMWTGVTWW